MQHDSSTLFIAALGLLHMQLKSSVLGVVFAVEPVCTDAPVGANAAPFAHESPIAEEAAHNLHSVEAEMVVRRQGFWNQERLKLSESLAHLVSVIMRRVCCDASVAFRASCV